MIKSIENLRLPHVLCVGILFMVQMFAVNAQQTSTQLLVGTWDFNDTSSFAKIDANIMSQLDTIPQLKTQILNSYTGRQLSFSENGTCVLSMPTGASFSYGWSISNDGKLVLTDSLGNVRYQTIKVLTNQELIIVPIVEGDTRIIITEKHFTKQQ